MKKLYSKLKSKKGFTLAESVVAIAILAIASMIFATFLATSNRMTMLTLKNEEDYRVLQEALATGNNVGSIEVQTENNKSFIIDLEGAIISVNGKYVTVENPKTEQKMVIFVGDNTFSNVPKAENGPFTADKVNLEILEKAYSDKEYKQVTISSNKSQNITIDLSVEGTKIYKSGDGYVVVVPEKKSATSTTPAVSYSIMPVTEITK